MSGPAPTALPSQPVSDNPRMLRGLILQRELANLAYMIALEAPERFSKAGYTTVVNRATVSRIRTVLSAAGIDWTSKHREIRRK